MPKRSPPELARLCFRIAADERSPQGERDAALSRGMAILQRHRLNPDHFAIPGRVRAAPNYQAPPHQFGTAQPEMPDWAASMARRFWASAAAGHIPLDDLVRESVREAMRRRHEARWRGGMEAPGATHCRHGNLIGGAPCRLCESEARTR